jgi:hypothetical protein
MGCGAYKCPPKQIAKFFKDIIENEYFGYFNYIIFSIIEDHHSNLKHNLEGNLKPFQNEFKESFPF